MSEGGRTVQLVSAEAGPTILLSQDRLDKYYMNSFHILNELDNLNRFHILNRFHFWLFSPRLIFFVYLQISLIRYLCYTKRYNVLQLR